MVVASVAGVVTAGLNQFGPASKEAKDAARYERRTEVAEAVALFCPEEALKDYAAAVKKCCAKGDNCNGLVGLLRLHKAGVYQVGQVQREDRAEQAARDRALESSILPVGKVDTQQAAAVLRAAGIEPSTGARRVPVSDTVPAGGGGVAAPALAASTGVLVVGVLLAVLLLWRR